MYGAWAYNHQQALLLVYALDHSGDLLTALDDGALRLLGLGDLMLEQVGGCERVVATNWSIVARLAQR